MREPKSHNLSVVIDITTDGALAIVRKLGETDIHMAPGDVLRLTVGDIIWHFSTIDPMQRQESSVVARIRFAWRVLRTGFVPNGWE